MSSWLYELVLTGKKECEMHGMDRIFVGAKQYSLIQICNDQLLKEEFVLCCIFHELFSK